MTMEELKLQPLDFRELSPARWRFRRISIGTLLACYFLYAFIASLLLLTPDTPPEGTDLHAQSIITSSNAADVGCFDGMISGVHQRQLMMLATFGFLGSLFCITRIFVITTNRFDMPVVWYLTRPLQSILMSWFFYYAFLAGQFIFYSGDPSTMDAKNINIYSLAIIAIIAGVFTEQAYESLRVFAIRLFKHASTTPDTTKTPETDPAIQHQNDH